MAKTITEQKEVSKNKTNIQGMVEQNLRLEIFIKELNEKGDKDSKILADSFCEMQKSNEKFISELLKK